MGRPSACHQLLRTPSDTETELREQIPIRAVIQHRAAGAPHSTHPASNLWKETLGEKEGARKREFERCAWLYLYDFGPRFRN